MAVTSWYAATVTKVSANGRYQVIIGSIKSGHEDSVCTLPSDLTSVLISLALAPGLGGGGGGGGVNQSRNTQLGGFVF